VSRVLRTETEVAEAAKADLKRAQQEESDLAWILSDPRGRRFVWRFLERGHVFSPVFAEGVEIYRNAARHDFCLRYLSQVLTAMPDALQVMSREASKKDPDD
jgi:hypothetical protein